MRRSFGRNRLVVMTLIWAVICLAAGVVSWKLTWGRIGERTAATRRKLSPDEILKERFAHGEIDETEFRRRMKALRGESD